MIFRGALVFFEGSWSASSPSRGLHLLPVLTSPKTFPDRFLVIPPGIPEDSSSRLRIVQGLGTALLLFHPRTVVLSRFPLPPLFFPHRQRQLRRLPGRLRQGVQRLLRQEGSPGQRSRGLAAGIFAGCFPFFGFQTLLGVALSSLLRGNRILAAASTWVSNPFTYLPLYWFNYTIGKRLLGDRHGGINTLHGDTASSVSWKDVWSLGWAVTRCVLLGSTLVGLVLGASLGLLCWFWLRRTRPTP